MEELKTHLLESLAGSLWGKIGIQHHHGINLPLSALHSKHSSGIGEFYDLIPIIDWCQKIGFDVIQLLPLNHSEKDPSPYNAISSCAINFIYLSLQELPHLDLAPIQKKKLEDFTELTRLQRIHYQEVLAQKLIWLHAYFEQTKESLIHSPEFQEFVSTNPWVEFYGLFHALKDHLGNASWTTWPTEVKSPSEKDCKELIKLYEPKVTFHMTMQYLCYLQLKTVRNYAKERGILLMGDIPILVSPDSADAWQYPEYFDINLSAGAPPDALAEDGQCWGLPLFRWDAMRKNQFDWWKQRLRYASNFFDICRLDHVVGFFRIWAIPIGHSSKEGYFIPDDENQWEVLGRELLKMLVTSSPMLPLAEDLGSIPKMVRPTLYEMGICGTKVMRWMIELEPSPHYIPIEKYARVSLTTISTHDMPTLQQWWKISPEESKLYAQSKNWEYIPDLSIEQRKEILWESHHTSSLFHINLLQEYLALFPELVSSNPEDERINTPGKILPNNWTYRFRPSVEELTSHEPLTKALKKIIK